MMARTAMIHARIEPDLKSAVEDVLHNLGLTTTEAIKLFFRQVQMRNGLPFAVAIQP
jgi:DNA-damage-inducible protein J